jgi:hypothetical protein
VAKRGDITPLVLYFAFEEERGETLRTACLPG